MIPQVKLEEEPQSMNVMADVIARAFGQVDGIKVSIVAGGKRGSEKNAEIAQIQRRAGRDPFFLKKETAEAMAFALRGVISAAYSVRKRAIQLAGDVLLLAIHKNVEEQRNPNGSGFKGLSKNYAAYKQRKFGFKVPILKATNDMLGGLKVKIEGLR